MQHPILQHHDHLRLLLLRLLDLETHNLLFGRHLDLAAVANGGHQSSQAGFTCDDEGATFSFLKQGLLLIKTNSALGGLSPVAFEAILSEDRPDAVFKEGFSFLSGRSGGEAD